MMNTKVLLVDDDQDMLDFIARSLNKENYEIMATTSPIEALEIVKEHEIDVIVTDERMPEMCGTEFIGLAKEIVPDTLRIMLTGNATLESAVEAINTGGVYRYLMKPVSSIDLAITIRQAIQQRQLVRETKKLLGVSQKQSGYIRELESDYPGISGYKTNHDGAILIEEPKSTDSIEALIRDINCEVEKTEKLLNRWEDPKNTDGTA